MDPAGDDVRARVGGDPVGGPSARSGAPELRHDDGSGAVAVGSPTGDAPATGSTLAIVAGRAAAGYVVLVAVAVVVGWGVRVLVGRSWFGDAEAEVTAWVVSQRTNAVSSLAATVSSLADTWTVIGVAAGAVVVLLVDGRVRLALVFVVGLPLELAVFLSVTYLVDRPRPAVETLASVPSTPSFPSGHVMAAVVLYGGLAVIVRARSRSRGPATFAVSTSVVIVALVASSRVYEGLHHPVDVVAGAVLGTACLAFTVVSARVVPGPAFDGTVARTERGSK